MCPVPARSKTKYGRALESNPSGRRTIIRNQIAPSLAQQSAAELKQQVFKKHQKTSKKSSGPSMARVTTYASAFLLLVAVVAVGYQTPQSANGQVASVTDGTSRIVQSSDSAPSLDEVVATGVAADLAERANLPVASNVANMAVSLTAKSELAQTDTEAITKPQIIKPTSTNRTITKYTAIKGDTVPSVAAKFNISADTIRWANGMINTDSLEPGRKLTILPTSGMLYTTKKGDTLSSVASTFKSEANRIKSYNDLELTGLVPGKKIIIPEGSKPAPTPEPTPAINAPTTSGSTAGSYGGGSGSRLNTQLAMTAGNRYAAGNCTWYAYERRVQLGKPVGSFWGNANTWASNAQAAGYQVNNKPSAGAILADRAGYFGHVGVVERVEPNGDIYITEMNNYAYGGFNIVNGRTISAGQAAGYLYIH